MATSDIPHIVKHATIAILREGKVAARSPKDHFRQALLIARSRMAQYGFVILGGQKATDPVHLTPKGKAREKKHMREGRAKSVLFDDLYKKYDLDGSRAKLDQNLRDRAAEAIANTTTGDERVRPGKK